MGSPTLYVAVILHLRAQAAAAIGRLLTLREGLLVLVDPKAVVVLECDGRWVAGIEGLYSAGVESEAEALCVLIESAEENLRAESALACEVAA